MLISQKKYYLIDHKILFLIGFIFYLITPVLLGTVNAFQEYPGVELFQGFFKKIPENKIRYYLIIILSWIPAFYLGHLFFKLIKPYKLSLQSFPSTFETRSIKYLAPILFVCLILFIFLARGALVGAGRYNVAVRGKLSTLIIIFDFFLVYQLISRTKVSKLIIIGIIINALVLLVAGGRLTALQTFIVFLIYKTSFATKRWKISHIFIFSLLAFILGGFIGIWRANAEFSFASAGFSFLAEPLFTWFSNASFMSENEIPLFNMPTNFLTSFFNIVPNTIFSLQQYVISVADMGYFYKNPFGADSIFTSLVINFGSIGSCVFIFITGFMLNFLRHLSEKSRFWATYYILVCAMLPFEFFRTGFYILNKELFFNFLLLPALILLTLKFFRYSQIELSKFPYPVFPNIKYH